MCDYSWTNKSNSRTDFNLFGFSFWVPISATKCLHQVETSALKSTKRNGRCGYQSRTKPNMRTFERISNIDVRSFGALVLW